MVYADLNADNEIFHTLAFLAGVTFWSQVHLLIPFNFFEDQHNACCRNLVSVSTIFNLYLLQLDKQCHFHFFYLICLKLLQITDLPFSLYSTFVIEARHGFNKVLGSH